MKTPKMDSTEACVEHLKETYPGFTGWKRRTKSKTDDGGILRNFESSTGESVEVVFKDGKLTSKPVTDMDKPFKAQVPKDVRQEALDGNDYTGNYIYCLDLIEEGRLQFSLGPEMGGESEGAMSDQFTSDEVLERIFKKYGDSIELGAAESLHYLTLPDDVYKDENKLKTFLQDFRKLMRDHGIIEMEHELDLENPLPKDKEPEQEKATPPCKPRGHHEQTYPREGHTGYSKHPAIEARVSNMIIQCVLNTGELPFKCSIEEIVAADKFFQSRIPSTDIPMYKAWKAAIKVIHPDFDDQAQKLSVPNQNPHSQLGMEF